MAIEWKVILILLVAVAAFILVRWVWRWKPPVGLVVRGEVRAIEKQGEGDQARYRLRLRVESSEIDEHDWVDRLLRFRAPKRGREFTWRVPGPKMRDAANLCVGDKVEIKGRTFRGLTGAADLSVHGVTPLPTDRD